VQVLLEVWPVLDRRPTLERGYPTDRKQPRCPPLRRMMFTCRWIPPSYLAGKTERRSRRHRLQWKLWHYCRYRTQRSRKFMSILWFSLRRRKYRRNPSIADSSTGSEVSSRPCST